MFELSPDNALGGQPKPIAVKGKRAFKIGDAKCQNGNPGGYAKPFLSALHRARP